MDFYELSLDFSLLILLFSSMVFLRSLRFSIIAEEPRYLISVEVIFLFTTPALANDVKLICDLESLLKSSRIFWRFKSSILT